MARHSSLKAHQAVDEARLLGGGAPDGMGGAIHEETEGDGLVSAHGLAVLHVEAELDVGAGRDAEVSSRPGTCWRWGAPCGLGELLSAGKMLRPEGVRRPAVTGDLAAGW